MVAWLGGVGAKIYGISSQTREHITVLNLDVVVVWSNNGVVNENDPVACLHVFVLIDDVFRSEEQFDVSNGNRGVFNSDNAVRNGMFSLRNGNFLLFKTEISCSKRQFPVSDRILLVFG